ncbi:MAG TPA: hypothetical protein VL401_03975 [Alphaproteobacteria bacterium]|jgi:hypothetical protein|nr:hypothetical protein [Alphaproteobacteria bacterium]
MKKFEYVFLLAIILIHIFVLSKLIFFPYPELFVYPYLTNHGLVPYRDIFDQHFPGLMFLPINLNNLGMTTPEASRLWQFSIVIIINILLFLIGKKIFNSSKKALLTNLIFLIWQPFFEGWVLWIDSFLPILTLLSLYFLKSKKIFWAGFFLGVALVFKQVIAPLILLIGIYLFFKERKLKTLFLLGLGILIPVSLLILHLTKLDIWKDFIFWTVTFNMTTFAQMGRKYGTLSELAGVIGVYGFAVFAFFERKFRNDVILISIFLIGSLASIYARFDFVHLQPSLPFLALLTVFSLDWLMKRKYLKVLILVYISAFIFLLFQFYKGHLGNKVFFFGNTEKKIVSEIQILSSPQDKIFALGTLPHIYQMADRLPPGNVFVFQFPWFMVEAENRILTGIIGDPPKVVIREASAEVEGKNLLNFMPKISDYVNRNYKVVDKIDDIEIMIRK